MSAMPVTEHYRGALDTSALPGASNEWLKARRQLAWDVFEREGFPSTRLEDWKYTRVKAVESTLFVAPEAPTISQGELDALAIPELDAYRMVFVNGQFDPDLSDAPPANVVMTNLAAGLDCKLAEACEVMKDHLGEIAKPERSGFVALNTALAADGAYIHVPRGETIDKPILLHFVSKGMGAPFMAQIRNLIHVDASAQVSVVELYTAIDGEDDYLNNVVTEVSLADNAGLTHYKVDEEGAKSNHVHWIEAVQDTNSRFSSNAVAMGAVMSRTDIHTHLNGEGADVQMNGLYRLQGRQHADFHTRINHAVPHCTSHEFYKGVLDDRSHGVFNGKVVVAPHAQKTDSIQKNDNLLLSRHAEVDTKPELEIYADDVKCAHGATVGQLRDESLFYLRSRGIDPEAARSLLVFAFANEVIERFPLAPLRDKLEKELMQLMR
ncbi:MAG: Fe-S cluster assembly protein SufD [Gammaproteobacteria bacterium]